MVDWTIGQNPSLAGLVYLDSSRLFLWLPS